MRLWYSCWEQKYGKEYNGNSHADQWIFIDMLRDMSIGEAQQVIKYYFQVQNPGHPMTWFRYHYHELYEQWQDVEADRQMRRRLQQQTLARLRAHEASNDK